MKLRHTAAQMRRPSSGAQRNGRADFSSLPPRVVACYGTHPVGAGEPEEGGFHGSPGGDAP